MVTNQLEQKIVNDYYGQSNFKWHSEGFPQLPNTKETEGFTLKYEVETCGGYFHLCN